MKLWDKGFKIEKIIEDFTVGNDRQLDLLLAKYDVLGSIAHARMLQSINILTSDELEKLEEELLVIYKKIDSGKFKIAPNVEDVHSQVEIMLTDKLGEIGKKIHSGRSRNDQVLLDIKLYLREEIHQIVNLCDDLFKKLMILSQKYKNAIMPGYTHFQVAMPSSFGLWFGAYAETLIDDLMLLQAAFRVANHNPLGSAAGYGTSFPINRTMTTKLLGFEDLTYNVIAAQMSRGKTETTVAFALSSVASTLSKFSMDICLYNSQNFDFVSFPKEMTTGSSIMPHKQNPDVFELIRAKCNRIKALSNELQMSTSNLPSGYHRDFQITKDILFPSIGELKNCLNILTYMLAHIKVNTNIINDDKYKLVFSVEEVNKEVLKGTPFRDAYKKVGEAIANGSFEPDKEIHHTHEGSINNLCNEEIAHKFTNVLKSFDFNKYQKALQLLVPESKLKPVI